MQLRSDTVENDSQMDHGSHWLCKIWCDRSDRKPFAVNRICAQPGGTWPESGI